MTKLTAAAQSVFAIAVLCIIWGVLFVFSVVGGFITAVLTLLALLLGTALVVGHGFYEHLKGREAEENDDGVV